MIQRILLLSEAQLSQPLLLRQGVIDEGAALLFRLAPPAADHAIDPTVQDVEALLGKQQSHRVRPACRARSLWKKKRFHATHVRGDAASAAAGRRIQRLQFSDDLLQLSRQLQVCAGAQLRPQVLQAVDGHVLPRLNQNGHGGGKHRETASSLALGVALAAISHPAGGDGVLEHTADGRSERPRLPPQQALHAALGRQQGEVRQAPVAMETEQFIAVDGNILNV